MIVESIVIALITFLIYGSALFITDRIFYRRLPPGPIPLPFIGTVYRMNPKIKPWRIYTNLTEEFGDIYTFYLGQLRMIFIHGVKHTRNALVNNAKLFSDRPYTFMPGYETSLHNGIVRPNGNDWMANRKFALSGLRKFGVGQNAILVNIQDEASNLVRILNQRCHGNVENSLAHLIQNSVFNVICSLIFGKKFDLSDPNFWAIRDASQIVFERPLEENAIHMALPFITRLSFPPQVKDLLKVNNEIERLLSEAINDRKKQGEKEEIEDFIDLFVKNSQNMSTRTIIGITSDLILAGTESTSALLTWAVLYLCKWPGYQTKCQHAIDQVITCDRMPTLDDRKKLSFIEAFMNEVHRHVTVAPNMLFHSVSGSDVTFEGYEIPAKSPVIFNIWAIHHDKDYWVDPENFRPERWLDAGGNLIDHSSHYMPFGIGPRICMGDNLAKVEYFVFIVTILHRFNFKFPNDDYDIDLESGRCGLINNPPTFDYVLAHRSEGDHSVVCSI